LRIFSGAALLLGVGAMTGVPAHAAQSANVSASSTSSPIPDHLGQQLRGQPVQLRAGVLDRRQEQHHPLGGDRDRHQQRVRDRSLRGVHLAEQPTTLSGCTVPPQGPGGFYPYWTQLQGLGRCALEFGNVSTGFGRNDFGKDAQYGTNQFATLGYPEFEGPVHNNTCARF
jgi:hypothetical protein